MMHTSIIIVNWNGKENTLECLASIRKLSHKITEVKTVLVDNHSSDDSVQTIRKQYGEVEVIDAGRNLGFTGGNNLGILHALKSKPDYIWLLNNDTIVDSTTLDQLLPEMSDKTVGIASPKIYFYPGCEFHYDRYTKTERGKVIWYAGGLMDWRNVYASHRGVDSVDMGQYDETTDTQFISGCAMMVKSEVFEKIGLLDDRYYLYLEDLDFSVRAISRGYRLLYVGKSHIWHKNAGSTSKPGNDLHEYYFTRNRILLGLKYSPIRTKIALLRQGIHFILKGNGVRSHAVIDAFTGRYGVGYLWKK